MYVNLTVCKVETSHSVHSDYINENKPSQFKDMFWLLWMWNIILKENVFSYEANGPVMSRDNH